MKDIQGREYAKYSQLKAGDKLECDSGFTCLKEGQVIYVRGEGENLFINCEDGKHSLDGQIYDEKDDSLVGLYKVQP